MKGHNGSFVFISWAGSYGNVTYTYPTSTTDYASDDSCVKQLFTKPPDVRPYYNITVSKSTLTFYNDGKEIVLSQGCP